MAEQTGPAKVVFACVANAGRSQMAAAFFNKLANPARALAISAGTRPEAAVHPEVVAAMREVGIDLSSAKPRYLSTDLAKDAHIVVTMGCGDDCPLIPGVERDDWALEDPKGQPLETVRRIRDEIRRNVSELVKERKWG
jgi:arsenate reductase